MRTDTQTITLPAPPAEVIDFVADPENLPRWAIGFAQKIRQQDDEWVVTTPQGEVAVRIETDRSRGTVDYVMSPAPGVELTAYSRVLPNGDGAELVFTQLQAPDMPDQVFEGQIEALHHELGILANLLAVHCPTG